MVGPPPPPPGPPPPPCAPPPPVFSPPATGKKGKGGGDQRSALLQSIQKGTKLKKTVTNDKSGPSISGKVVGANGTSSYGSDTTDRGLNNYNSNNNSSSTSSVNQNGMPKLGGIFGGMSSMPKLKPVGSRGATNRSPTNDSYNAQPEVNQEITQNNNLFSNNSNSSGSHINSNGAPLDFNSELVKTLTLKKKQKEQQSGQNDVIGIGKQNRGPPPQPPMQKILSSSTSDTIIGKVNLSSKNSHSELSLVTDIEPNSSSLFKKQQNNSSSTSSISTITNGGLSLNASSSSSISSLSSALSISNQQITANKSSLFNSFNNKSDNSDLGTTTTTASSTGSTKFGPNHGKPNLAPKPPGMQIPGQKNSNNNRPVSRHHSMKTPRSPPIAPAGNLVFPSSNQFGTIRGVPQQIQQNENIVMNGNRPIARPTVAPPPRPNKPPPPPTRSVSNSNLSTIPLSLPTSANLTSNGSSLSVNSNNINNNNNNVNNFGSMKNLKEPVNGNNLGGSVNNINSKITSNGNIAPPLPPHRPPPPKANMPVNSSAPVPPARVSSIRSTSAGPAMTSHHNQNNNTQSSKVSRLIIDLETKFSNQFHNVTEFPKPLRFTNTQKTYPSQQQTIKSANARRRQVTDLR